MKKISLLLILVYVFLAGCTARPVKYKILPVPLLGQETRMWCWAASGEMIMDYYGDPMPQHVQANNRFKRSDCGSQTRSRACIKGGRPELEKYGFNRPRSKYGALSWEELVYQIDAGSPVGFSWEWKKCGARRSYGSHYMVARGYITLNGTRLVVVNDPFPVNADKFKGGSLLIMTYRDYVKFCPRYIHSYTHYGIATKGSLPRSRLPVPPKAAAPETAPDMEPLELLKALPPSILKELGFHSPSKIERCSLGKPLGIYVTGSRKLKVTRKSDEHPEMPENAYEVHYAVMVDGEPVTSIIIRKRAGKWAFALIGDKKAAAAAKAMKEMPLSRGEPPDYFMVEIQSLNLSYLAYVSGEEGNILYFVPTLEDPDLTFPLHEPVPAADVFWELLSLLEQMVEEQGETEMKGELAAAWNRLDNALDDMESGEKDRVLGGMNRAVKLLDDVFVRLESENKEDKES